MRKREKRGKGKLFWTRRKGEFKKGEQENKGKMWFLVLCKSS